MTKSISDLFDERVARDAELSVNRNMYELHEADARVRQFKAGAQSLKALVMELDEALALYGNSSTYVAEVDANISVAKRARAKLRAWLEGGE